jgi:tRNA A-37 threonylcarbamoyl transferase component Bud32
MVSKPIAPASGTTRDELAPGTRLLLGQYRIERYLNSGGFGITYLARDSLDRPVVLKECFPQSFCLRTSKLQVQSRSEAHLGELRSIVRLFAREARALSKLKHPNIVGVHQVFEDNNTAYMALDFVDGHDIKKIIKQKVVLLRPDQIEALLGKCLDAIACVHDAGLLHRDISPDNIIVKGDLEPVLIDFGAAREQATKATQALSALRVVKDGYSPQEFYMSAGEQSPASDLYSLAATFYHLVTGELPPDSQVRLMAQLDNRPDPYVPLARKTASFSPAFCAALDKAMAIMPGDRLRSAEEWKAAMKSGKGLGMRGPVALLPKGRAARIGLGGALAAGVVGAAVLLGGPMTGLDLQAIRGAVDVSALFERAAPAAPAADAITYGWVAEPPFELDAEGRVTRVAAGQPGWLVPGLTLAAIDGRVVAAGDFGRTLDALTQGAEGPTVRASMSFLARGGAELVSGNVEIPVGFRTVLASGVTFASRITQTGWATEVTDIVPGSATDLQVGDSLVALIDRGERVTGGEAFAASLLRGLEAGDTLVRVAVNRADTLWTGEFALAAAEGRSW